MNKKIILLSLCLLTIASPTFAKTKKVVRKVQPKKVRLTNAVPIVGQSVPFYEQIVGSSWNDPVAADACEEDAVLMSVAWATGQSYSAAEARAQIKAMAEYEQEHFGAYQDSSAADTAQVLTELYHIPMTLRYDVSVLDLRNILAAGHIAIIPINGQRLDNPHYGNPGPARHMVIVTGYDPNTDEFIINDPGTRFGNGQRFSSARIQNALEDYQTGNHIKNKVIRTAMIEVQKPAQVSAATVLE